MVNIALVHEILNEIGSKLWPLLFHNLSRHSKYCKDIFIHKLFYLFLFDFTYACFVK
jgi:hypothetical protein